MNSIFLRIYGGMLGVLVLVALLGVFALHVLNQSRGEQYRERLAHGTFTVMADNLVPLNDIERRRALAIWERLLGIPSACKASSRLDWTTAHAVVWRVGRWWSSRSARTPPGSIVN